MWNTGRIEEICDYKETRDTFHSDNVKLVPCHYPILMWKGQHHGSILLYGHVHNSIEESYFQKCLREMNNDVFFGDKAGYRFVLKTGTIMIILWCRIFQIRNMTGFMCMA